MKMSMEYPCIYFDPDGKCRKFSDENTTSHCVMGPCPEQKLSNADNIRAMNDEELAHLITGHGTFECRMCEIGDQRVCDTECEKHCIIWLQSPAEENT